MQNGEAFEETQTQKHTSRNQTRVGRTKHSEKRSEGKL